MSDESQPVIRDPNDTPYDALGQVLRQLSQLYQVYYRANTSDVYQHRIDIERHLHGLMSMYDQYLG